MDPTTLKEDWKCSDGEAWRTTGLECAMAEYVSNEHNMSVHDEPRVADAACHQPLVGSYSVKMLPVTLLVEEEA